MTSEQWKSYHGGQARSNISSTRLVVILVVCTSSNIFNLLNYLNFRIALLHQ